ncbi:MAG: hypothetical protein WBW31_04330 [Candidatus Sulfotelmatobacter sp.]|jgi:hypothetical protein
MKHENLNNGALDRELDAALAKFTAGEPRAGLEDRILANLRAQQAHVTVHSWWRWPALATLTAAIVVTVFLAWRLERPVQKTASNPSANKQIDRHAGTQVKQSGSGATQLHDAGSRRQLKPRAVRHSVRVASPAPKLDQFPSPQPLSEQERILARYIANYPEQAALVAQARADLRRRDAAEEIDDHFPDDFPNNFPNNE